MNNKITRGSDVDKLQPLDLKCLENTNEKYNNVSDGF